MPNNNISAPLPDDADVNGTHHNTVRQDLLWNHRHTGPGDGGPISHTSLNDKGKYTHPEIDLHIDSPHAHGAPQGSQIVAGLPNDYRIHTPYIPGLNDGPSDYVWQNPAPFLMRMGYFYVDPTSFARYKVDDHGTPDGARWMTAAPEEGGVASKLVRFEPPMAQTPVIFLQTNSGAGVILSPNNVGPDGFDIWIRPVDGADDHVTIDFGTGQTDPDWLVQLSFHWLAIEPKIIT